MLFRPSRRLAAALLWVAIALLPLRALAAAWMPTAMAASGASVAVNEMASSMPCHGASAQAPADEAPAAAACAFCVFCHGSVMDLAAAPPALPVLHATSAPPAAPAALVQREPDGLFRPPRALLLA